MGARVGDRIIPRRVKVKVAPSDHSRVAYIDAWTELLSRHTAVKAWAYTRSWRVPELLSALERFRALPNVQLFASMDASTKELPPLGWRRAWVWPDERDRTGPFVERLWNAAMRRCDNGAVVHNQSVVADGTPTYVCPEETGRKPNCESCRYCFDGRRNDVTFLLHTGDAELKEEAA